MVDKQPKPPNIKIHKSVGSIPPFNLKSTIVPCTGTPYVFLYGGFDEYDALDGNVYILNTSTMEWEIDDKEDGLYREGHSAIYIGNGNVLIFGGLPFEDEVSNQPPPPPPPQPQPAAPTARHALRSSVLTPENNRQNINGLTNFGSNYLKKDSLMMIYNVIDKKWIGPPDFALENCPSSRSRHACCLSEDGSKLYISGGMVKSTPLNDLYCYDLVQGTWSGPMEFVFRFDHTIMVYQDKIFAFGGLEKDMNHVKSISYYSLKTKTVGEILIHDQANNKNVASHRPPVIFDMMVLNSKINHAVNLMISFPALIPSTGIEISSFNVNDFETQKLFDHHNLLHYFRNINMNDFFWKTAFITHEESLYFLGTRRRENKRGESHFGDFLPETTSEDNDVDQEQQQQQQQEGEIDEDLEYEYADETELRKLNHVLEIKLSYLGIPSQTEDLFFSDFHKLLLQQEFTDFEIISLATNDKDEKRFFGNTSEESEYETRSIPVHKTILLARWPHFYRMLTSVYDI
ncbi:hypothetical protein G210_2635 [Candida maltosa Xu316]|uniref:Galactose oxidase n=1 Tax=Candida maltosa (strain Xu316) TaxID=1245528 RepID=M3JW07_CANMX|nr:hypothetical protein G210_2635 [Candida maltosa Xu316]